MRCGPTYRGGGWSGDASLLIMGSAFTRGGVPVRRGQGNNQKFANEAGGAQRRGQEFIYGQQGILATVSSTVAGIAPPSGGGTANFLRADGTWAAPPAGAGSSTYSVVAKSVTYTETTTLGEIVIKASGTFTINLPTAVGNTAKYHVKLVAAGTVTIDPAGTETIDGSLTITISTLNDAPCLISDGANWQVV